MAMNQFSEIHKQNSLLKCRINCQKCRSTTQKKLGKTSENQADNCIVAWLNCRDWTEIQNARELRPICRRTGAN
ncbi:hypothetical protein A4A49_28111 [Nicotiana attenuata]|uniref:Uncharacterized protein n=1 Tax=Nicotiana attenuata TaxID=49451 RepID=A0A1J6KCW3_NICAT|nr:hypothetical protein A4A49_28111 [Nicotiana attenuata]